MPFVAFHELCPEVASRETRSINLLAGAKAGVPAGRYEFVEMYCDEPDCDCRRVFFSVCSSVTNQVEAIVAWGWEDCAFYKRWLGMDEPRMVREMQGPILNLGSPQTDIAEDLLELARNYLLADPGYVDRIKRHYTLFRSEITARVIRTKIARRKKARKMRHG